MTGLVRHFASLLKIPIETTTTSSSSETRTDRYLGLPLRNALARPVQAQLLIRGADGTQLLLSPSDVDDAYLVKPTPDAPWQVILLRDTTRRRRIKSPVAFVSD